MKRIPVTRTALAAAAALVGLVLAADAAPGDGPGWTGITNPKDVINAREELMEEIEHVMQPIDTFEGLLVKAIVWIAALLAIFIPLAIRLYRKLS